MQQLLYINKQHASGQVSLQMSEVGACFLRQNQGSLLSILKQQRHPSVIRRNKDDITFSRALKTTTQGKARFCSSRLALSVCNNKCKIEHAVFAVQSLLAMTMDNLKYKIEMPKNTKNDLLTLHKGRQVMMCLCHEKHFSLHVNCSTSISSRPSDYTLYAVRCLHAAEAAAALSSTLRCRHRVKYRKRTEFVLKDL